MVIICNGGYRTGSTLSFNICLKIAEKIKGLKFFSIGSNNKDTHKLCKETEASDKFWFVKSHEYRPRKSYANVKIVHTYRKPLSVAASMKQYMIHKTEDQIIAQILYQKRNLPLHEKRLDTLVIYYEQYDNLPNVIEAVSRHINLPVDQQQIAEIALNLSVDNIKNISDKMEQPADSYSQLRRNHISKYKGADNYWHEVLSPNFIERINQAVNR